MGRRHLNFRKAIGVGAYTITGIGRYNRETGEYAEVTPSGIIRCLECASQAVIPAEDVPAVQEYLASLAEEASNG